MSGLPSLCKPFQEAVADAGFPALRAARVEVLQVNLGRLCNQSCRHCHVEAGPNRRERMTRTTMQQCLNCVARHDLPVLDVTGGAPELNPHFRWFVSEARRLGRTVIDRCNLTVLVAPGYSDLAQFLAENHVTVVASLPCYVPENHDAQRGRGTLERSVEGLRRLNAQGYGPPESGLTLDLVFNPLGPSLPPSQPVLEVVYKKELSARYGVVFNRLLTFTNMPIGRFLKELRRSGTYDAYMAMLTEAFNPGAVPGLMCRSTVSVGWTGRLHDCDFNQMLGLGLTDGQPRHIADFDAQGLANRPINVGDHCYGCTAGCGFGCQGAIAPLVEA